MEGPNRIRCCACVARLRDRSGLSLIEVLVALGMLAVGLMAVAYLQSSGTRDGVAAYGVVTASSLAVQLGDKIRTLPYQDSRLTATTGFVVPDATLTNANPLGPDGSHAAACDPWQLGNPPKCGYARTWKITNGSPLANTKSIDVEVKWSEYGITRTLTLSTIKAVGS